jgi:hypothetical protein
MGLEIDWDEQVIKVTTPTVEVDGQTLHDFIEDQMATPEGLQHETFMFPEGKVGSGVVKSQIIMQFADPWQLQFWAGSGYTRVYGAKIEGGKVGLGPVAQFVKATGMAGDITVLESPVDGVVVVSGSGVTTQDKEDIADLVTADPKTLTVGKFVALK